MEIKGLSMLDELKMLRGVEPLTPPAPSGEKSGKASFASFLEQTFQEANQAGLEADRMIQNNITGRAENPHETLIAIQKAEVSFRLMLSVKDQLEQAYQQIIRTSIG